MARGPERILDEYLVASAKAGSREAFEQLVHRWTPRLLRYATRRVGAAEPARDIIQDAWISALRSLSRLDDPATFPAWMYSVVTRKCIDSIRKIVGRRKLDGEIAQDVTFTGAEIDPAQIAADRFDLAGAIARLSVEHRIVVDLFYRDDLSLPEISAAIGVPVGTVKSRLHHARQSLKQHFEGDDV